MPDRHRQRRRYAVSDERRNTIALLTCLAAIAVTVILMVFGE